MRSFLILSTVIFFLSLVSFFPALGQHPVLTKVSPPEGVDWGGITGIAQDRQGFLWLASQNGLHRYDGYQFVSYYHDPDDSNSLGASRITALMVSKSGIVWIGLFNNGLDRLDPETRTFTHFTHDPGRPGSLSNNTVTAILEDRQGVMWVGTHGGLHRFHPESGTFTLYQHNPQDPSSLSNNQVRALYEDRQGTLWVGTGSPFGTESGPGEGGLNRFKPQSGTFTRFLHDPNNPNTLIDNKVRAIFEDSRGTFWVGTLGDGLHTMDREKGTFIRHRHDPRRPEKLSRSPIIGGAADGVTFIQEDVTGAIWIGTYGSGVSRYDPRTGRVAHLEAKTKKNGGLQDNSVWWAHTSKEGVLWISTLEGDLYRTDPLRERFAYHHTGTRASGFEEDASGRVWSGTKYGLRVYDPYQGGYRPVKVKPSLPLSLENGPTRAILQDRQGTLWIGELKDGLKGLWRRDPKNLTFTRYAHDPKVPTSISEGGAICLYESRDGSIWVGTGNGDLNRMDPESGTFTRYRHDPEDPNSLRKGFVSAIHEDRQGDIWVGTQGVSRLDRSSGKFKRYLVNINTISAIREDAAGRVWVGSYQHGLFLYNQQKDGFARYKDKSTSKNINASVRGIVLDDQGNLWVSSTEGLAKIDQDGNLAAIYGVEMGLDPGAFQHTTFHKGRNGRLFLGDSTGFYTILPQEIKANENPPQIGLTDFRLFDQAAGPGVEGPLAVPVSQVREVELTHDQNGFSFDFISIHFTKPNQNRLFYMLEHYDADWRQAASDHTASYFKVPPGKYVFRVKAASSEGIWAEKALPVVIHPPWWQTWWAYGGYGLLLGAGLLLARRETVRRERLKAGLRIKQIEADKLREVDTLKSRFFSNVSHEFRTPLALIQGTVQKLAGQEQPGDERLPDYGLIHRSSERLLQLVNQLLDLARLEAGKLTLQPEPGEVVGFLALLVSSFASLFENKAVRYRCHLPPEPLWVLFEKDKLEKILSNLLSNACKFTPAGGEVVLEVEVERPGPAEAELRISVSDTGEGIPAELLARVFERFFQADPSATRAHEGAGIGLSLTKELVELHGGQIRVDSAPGKGTTFRISLPLAVVEQPVVEQPETAWQEEQDPVHERQALLSPEQPEKGRQGKPGGIDQTVVLVVEDNADLRHFIRDSLPAGYAVYEAEDGNAGWEKALEVLPDLIISDVMMPGLDGVSLCQRLKTDERTSHIAVVLLTAKADAESKMAGLETGADDYLTKPFKLEELQLRVRNLHDSRRKLRERYSRSLTLKPTEVTVASLDEKFLQKVLGVMEANLSNAELSVETFGLEIGMSRVHLHRKLTALTGQAASEFIRTFRLRRAASLLEQHHGNISDVAYAVGFKSLNTFTKSFREHYGQTPSEYVANIASAPASEH